MTRQTPQPLIRLRTVATVWQIEEYTDRIRRGERVIDPPYQRGRRWRTDQRIDLMRSWSHRAIALPRGAAARPCPDSTHLHIQEESPR